MTGQFGTDTEVMRATATRIATIHEQMDGRLALLRRQVESVSAQFVGAAGTSFQTTMMEFNRSADAFSRFLDQMQAQIQTSRAGSEQNDADGARTFTPTVGTTGISQALG